MGLLKFRTVTVLLLALFLGGCTTVKGWFSVDDDEGRQPAELQDYEAEISIKKLWSTGVGSGQGDAYHHLRPVINGETIYAAGNDGTVMAIDKTRGKKVWKEDFDVPFSGGVGYGSGMLLLGTSDGLVMALDAQTGIEQWSSELNGEIMSPPQTNGSVVVVQTYDGKIQGLSAEDGSEMWVYDSNLPVLTLRGTSAPLLYERFAIAGFGNGKVVAFDINTGAVRWEARVAIAQGRSEIDRIVDVDGSLLRMGTTLYAVSYQGRVAAIEITTGRKIWQEEISSYVGVGQGFGNIYVAEDSGTVTALHRNGQGVRWQNPDLAYRRLSAPRAVKGSVAVGDLDGYIHFLSQVDGHVVGRTKLGSNGVRADMLVEDNVLYAFGNSGSLAAFRVSSLESK